MADKEVDSTTGKYTRYLVWLSSCTASRFNLTTAASTTLLTFSDNTVDKSHRWYAGINELLIIAILIGSYIYTVTFSVFLSIFWYSRIYSILVVLFWVTYTYPVWAILLNLINSFYYEFSALISKLL